MDDRENREIKLDNLVKILSEERLRKAYELSDKTALAKALTLKAWNLALCASLYSILQIVEVCLRNSMHNAISDCFEDMNWFENAKILHSRELQTVKKTILGLEKTHRTSDPSYIISELPFGFWNNLLTKCYERKIWHPLLRTVFPYLPKSKRTRSFVYERFRQIRMLRNRVFHHQRIWHIPNLLEQKENIIEAIGWVDNSAVVFISKIGKFDDIYEKGFNYYKDKIEEVVNEV